jgi:hypothetical protein
MANPGLTKAYIADTDIPPYLILKAGSVDGNAALATASTDKLKGVSESVPVAAGQCVDVIHDGIANVTAGGTIADGDWLTVNASSQAITAAPTTGVNAQVIGKAMTSAAAGDIFPVLIQLGQNQG